MELGDGLVHDLAGSELTTLLLDVMRRRAEPVEVHEVLARLDADRFTRTSSVSPAAIRRVVDAVAGALPAGAIELELAPLVPFGTHSSVAGVDQNRVVSTARGSEVAADPTVVLAMEAAKRRKARLADDPKDADLVSLSACQRVTRAQQFEGAMSFAHFAVSGFVTAGRDTGNEEFELRAVGLHVEYLADSLRRVGCDAVEVLLSDFTGGRLTKVTEAIEQRWSGNADVTIVAFPERTRARHYYTDFAIEVHAVVAGEQLEVGDGGLTDWTQRLVGSRKERLMISGLGVERLALTVGS